MSGRRNEEGISGHIFRDFTLNSRSTSFSDWASTDSIGLSPSTDSLFATANTGYFSRSTSETGGVTDLISGTPATQQVFSVFERGSTDSIGLSPSTDSLFAAANTGYFSTPTSETGGLTDLISGTPAIQQVSSLFERGSTDSIGLSPSADSLFAAANTGYFSRSTSETGGLTDLISGTPATQQVSSLFERGSTERRWTLRANEDEKYEPIKATQITTEILRNLRAKEDETYELMTETSIPRERRRKLRANEHEKYEPIKATPITTEMLRKLRAKEDEKYEPMIETSIVGEMLRKLRAKEDEKYEPMIKTPIPRDGEQRSSRNVVHEEGEKEESKQFRDTNVNKEPKDGEQRSSRNLVHEEGEKEESEQFRDTNVNKEPKAQASSSATSLHFTDEAKTTYTPITREMLREQGNEFEEYDPIRQEAQASSSAASWHFSDEAKTTYTPRTRAQASSSATSWHFSDEAKTTYTPITRDGERRSSRNVAHEEGEGATSVQFRDTNVNKEQKGVLTTKTKNKAPLWTKKISVSSVITSEGGTVVGEGVKLVCAPGVVERPVTVTVTLEDPSKYCGLLVQNDLENDIMFCAPIINLQPNGHHFKRGVELTVRLKGAISSFNEVVILHGKETCLRKIAWEDITQNTIESNETSDEVIITTEQFSIIAAFVKRTLILTKDIASRLNLLGYNYSLLVLFNDKSVPNQLAVVFVSEDVENEASFQEDKTSVLVQLKEEGFREIFLKGQDDRRIYNHEELKVSTSLGEDFKCSSSDLTVVVESSTWWSTGHAIKLTLESTKQDKILCGRITVKGEYGNSKEMTFCDLGKLDGDIHGYVRDLLGVKGDIFNVIPIAEALKLPKEALHEIKEKWRDDECQLEVILEQSDVSSLKEVLEGLKPDYRLTTERGQMHVKHLRYLATKIGSLEHDSVELEKYFASKIHAYCQMVLRDCCLEMESTAYGVGKAASSTNLAAFITIRMQGSIPDCLKDFLFFACKDICSSSEECIIDTFKSVVPELIQMIKEVFVENDTNHEEQNGLQGLSDETLAPFELSIRIARQDKTVLELLSVVSKILEKLCQHNCSHERVSEVEKWGKSAANLAMLDFLNPFFQNCPKNRRLHKRLELFSQRMVDILSNPREFADEVFIRNFANIALSLIHFAKFDASKLVRFVLIDSSNSCINCSREHTQYDLNRNPSVFSQTIHVKKESEDELKLHASASVHMGGEIHEVGSFQSVIMLCESGWESLEKCRRKMPRVTTAKMKDKDSDNLRVVLCSSQKQELSEVLQVLGSEMSEGLVDLTKSQVTQCPLTARNISAKAGKVLSLRLIYKWGSGSLDLESKDFVVCANSSARSASFSELPLFGFSTAAQLDEAAVTQGNPFPLASADVNLNFPICQPFSQRPLNIQSRKVGNEDKALALPDKIQESLASLSCDPQRIVSLFKENQSLMEASLEQPDYQSMKWIRCLSRKANIAKRLDVVKHLRSISLAGTVGPLLSENLDVREIPIKQGRQLTMALSGGDEWKLVAEKLGLNPREIRYLDKRVLNPAEALLAYEAEKRGLTVGELYDVLSDCGLPLLADEL